MTHVETEAKKFEIIRWNKRTLSSVDPLTWWHFPAHTSFQCWSTSFLCEKLHHSSCDCTLPASPFGNFCLGTCLPWPENSLQSNVKIMDEIWPIFPVICCFIQIHTDSLTWLWFHEVMSSFSASLVHLSLSWFLPKSETRFLILYHVVFICIVSSYLSTGSLKALMRISRNTHRHPLW